MPIYQEIMEEILQILSKRQSGRKTMGLRTWITLLTALCLVTGCGGTASQEPSRNNIQEEAQSPLPETEGDFQVVEPGSIYTGPVEAPMPEASGEVVYEGNGVTVDASHMEDGYIMVKGSESDTRLKTLVMLGGETYSYDLNQEGGYEVYPLQMGNGTYEIEVYQQVEGTTYSKLYFVELEVQ